MAVTPERMTLAEFLTLPEVKPARELRHGVVSQKVPPSGSHGSMQSWFAAQVFIYGQMRRVAQSFTETRVILGRDTYVPDVSVYVWDRIPEEDESGTLNFHFTAPPDLILEVISPGQTVGSLLDRCRELIAHGVRVAVLADPVRQAVHTLRPGREIGPLRRGDAIDIADILPDLKLTVSDLLNGARSARYQG